MATTKAKAKTPAKRKASAKKAPAKKATVAAKPKSFTITSGEYTNFTLGLVISWLALIAVFLVLILVKLY